MDFTRDDIARALQGKQIVNRGMLVPRVEYDDGSQGWGVPGLLMEPIEAWQRLQAGAGENVARMQQGLPFDPQAAGDAFSVAGGVAVGNAVPQVARSLVKPAARGAAHVQRFADDAIDMEAVSPGHGFGSGGGTPSTNWIPWSKAYPDPQQSPYWPSSWGDDVSAVEKAAFAKSEYLRGLWREEMNKRWSPDWDRPMVERDVMDAYPGLGEAMRQADAEFAAIRKGMPAGSDPWANDPYAWFNRPHELGSPDLTAADVAGHMADSMRQEAARSRPAPKSAGMLDSFSNPKESAALGAAVQGEKQGIRAYHGSPNDFDKFDMRQIGTGEGAQVYGHGLYFAEKEGVARSYRNNLSGPYQFSIDGRRLAGLERNAAAAMHEVGGSHRRAIDEVVGDGPLKPIIERWERDGIAPVRDRDLNGRMYEVRINADPEDFLDWDKPLAQQSEAVQKAVHSAVAERLDDLERVHAYQQKNFKGGALPQTIRNLERAKAIAAGKIPEDAMVSDVLPGSEGAAKLREAGIPGIKYLDGNSRAAGEGSRNYVVFDDSLVEILRKYGIAGGMSLLGLSQSLGQDQQETY